MARHFDRHLATLSGLRQHSLIAFEQQRFGFRYLFCPARLAQALGAEPLPTVRLVFSIELQGLASEGRGLAEFPLRQIDEGQSTVAFKAYALSETKGEPIDC